MLRGVRLEVEQVTDITLPAHEESSVVGGVGCAAEEEMVGFKLNAGASVIVKCWLPSSKGIF